MTLYIEFSGDCLYSTKENSMLVGKVKNMPEIEYPLPALVTGIFIQIGPLEDL